VPYRTGQLLDADALLAIAAIDGVAGMKQSAGLIDDDVMRFMAARPDDFAVLCGDDALILPLMALGAVGAIAASAHFATGRFASLLDSADRAEAEALLPLVLALFAEPNPAVLKGLLHSQGRIPTPDVRMPMTGASEAGVDRAARALEAISLPV
jgi:4-hydroxy-tetrahydrodipicolinate synthase